MTQPRMIPKWNLPASSWKRPKAMRKRKGPERSASSWRSGLTRKGLRVEVVLRQIWRVLMPSSSRRGGSSSKEVAPPERGPPTEEAKTGAEKEEEAGAEPTSNDMKGRLGLEGPPAEEAVGRGAWKGGAAGARRWWGTLGLPVEEGKTTGGTLNSFAIGGGGGGDCVPRSGFRRGEEFQIEGRF